MLGYNTYGNEDPAEDILSGNERIPFVSKEPAFKQIMLEEFSIAIKQFVTLTNSKN